MSMMARQQVLSLIIVAIVGLSVTHCLQANRPIGRRVSDTPAIAEILVGGGSPEAVQGEGDLTVVVFTDYQCMACRVASRELSRAITRDGNVRIVYKDWPLLGPRSQRAAQVALASRSQGIYPRVYSRLMEVPAVDDETLRDVIERAGGDWNRLTADLLANGPAISDQLAANQLDAMILGLQGTPGYLIGPLLVEGALTEAEFLRAFEQARSVR